MTTRRKTAKTGRSNTAPPPEPPEIDPILPLPAHTEIPVVHQGDGAIILNDTRMMVIEMPYRAMYMCWEYAERRAEKMYPQYSNRSDGMENAAEAILEAVHAFRSAFRGEVLPMMTKEQARDARIERAQWVEAQTKKKAKPKTGESGTSEEPSEVTEDSISETPKKARCREEFDGGGRCIGPDNGHKRHKDKQGNRWTTE